MMLDWETSDRSQLSRGFLGTGRPPCLRSSNSNFLPPTRTSIFSVTSSAEGGILTNRAFPSNLALTGEFEHFSSAGSSGPLWSSPPQALSLLSDSVSLWRFPRYSNGRHIRPVNMFLCPLRGLTALLELCGGVGGMALVEGELGFDTAWDEAGTDRLKSASLIFCVRPVPVCDLAERREDGFLRAMAGAGDGPEGVTGGRDVREMPHRLSPNRRRRVDLLECESETWRGPGHFCTNVWSMK